MLTVFFLLFLDHFIAMYGIESVLKNFWEKVHDWLKQLLVVFSFVCLFILLLSGFEMYL